MKFQLPDGTLKQGTARIKTWFGREDMSKMLEGLASFEITELSMPTAIGTYIDSPFNRYPDGRDISELQLEELILPGVVLDLREHPLGQPVPASAIPEHVDIRGAAILFNFGWDRHWGKNTYWSDYPYISPELAASAAHRGARLLGFDTGNADGRKALAHPVHTALLAQGILIVENLTNLDLLHGNAFRFFAIPIKGRRVASMTLRAFAELTYTNGH